MSEAAMSAYPVSVSVATPDRFQRVHLLLRIGLWVVVTYLFNSVLLLAGPVISAVLVAQRGDQSFHERYGEIYGKVVAFMMGLQGYMLFASDDFRDELDLFVIALHRRTHVGDEETEQHDRVEQIDAARERNHE